MISIHAPTRGATQLCLCSFQFLAISIHAPTRGATVSLGKQVSGNMDFNPRSHERSDEEGKEQERYLQISIHAPTRGATTARVRRYCKLSISIHAPTRGATAWRRSNALHHVHFNPRSHERSDTITYAPIYHAGNFNPRSHERSDLQP